MKKIKFIPYIGLLFLISGCFYRPDITQGVALSDEQVAAILPQMPRKEVHQILGTPTILDPLHKDIDQYVYFLKSGKSGRTYKRSLIIQYNSDDTVLEKTEKPLTVN